MSSNTIGQLRNDMISLSAQSLARERALSRKAEELSGALAARRRELARAVDRSQALASPPLLTSSKLVAAIWKLARRRAIKQASSRKVSLEADILRIVEEGRSVSRLGRTMAAAAARLSSATEEIKDLDHPPDSVAERLGGLAAAVAALVPGKDPKQLLSVARDAVNLVETWAKASRAAREKTRAEGHPNRIWLPIPASTAFQAGALGARLDKDVADASAFYVEVGDPLAKFNALLPHAYRETRPKLNFASARADAARQNIASFVDALSWDHIRNVNYSMTGRRCILCGKQGGSLRAKIEPAKAAGGGSVECHEIWNWTRPDPAIPVGVQSLERIMVVCFDCHMCFHDDIARALAGGTGVAGLERQVQGYLIKRRGFLTRTDPKEVVLEMQAEQARLAEHKDVGTWIVDLSKLAKQDYMYGQTPTLLASNPSGIKASQVAGIAFREEDGTLHQAVSAERLYQEASMRFVVQPEPRYKVVSRK
jgi:hypothetical protein